jgi:hypothetical protein
MADAVYDAGVEDHGSGTLAGRSRNRLRDDSYKRFLGAEYDRAIVGSSAHVNHWEIRLMTATGEAPTFGHRSIQHRTALICSIVGATASLAPSAILSVERDTCE